MNKKKLRKLMLEKRNTLLQSDIIDKSHEINEKLITQSFFRTSKTILSYISINNEPDTQAILQTAWQLKKQILVPVCQPSTNTLLISRLENLQELEEGHFHILEPKKEYLRPVKPSLVDLCILPGTAFDRNGYRLGYGSGYFDRFLPLLRSDCLKIALSYDYQILDTIPHESHDIPVDIILTEKAIYYCSRE
ncbi:MAG: 5-formyltetrahydrofolate cyclo-ligase [Clostridia bacterium]|nr:5-formyltetrahydrofolate cyclo-ligase [Clostridia bacterium]MDD4048056.1 5-formyltetrahydrofolate cyclo-ligase [Clostridia bacterium]